MVSLNGSWKVTEVLICPFREAKVTDPCSRTLLPTLRYTEKIWQITLPLCAVAVLLTDKTAPGGGRKPSFPSESVTLSLCVAILNQRSDTLTVCAVNLMADAVCNWTRRRIYYFHNAFVILLSLLMFEEKGYFHGWQKLKIVHSHIILWI